MLIQSIILVKQNTKKHNIHNNQYYNQHNWGLIGWMIVVCNMSAKIETGVRIWIVESVDCRACPTTRCSLIFRGVSSGSSRRMMLVVLLARSGNFEANPGPNRCHIIFLGSLNIRSGVNKVAALHDIISDRWLDILVIQESWIPSNAPVAIKNNLASSCWLHRCVRPPWLWPDGPKRNGDLAIIHRNSLAIRDFDLPVDITQPMAFELQLVCISFKDSRSVI